MTAARPTFASDRRRRRRPRAWHVGAGLMAVGGYSLGLGAVVAQARVDAMADALVRAPLRNGVVTLDGPATYEVHVETHLLFTTVTREVGSGDNERTVTETVCRQPECDRLLAGAVEVVALDTDAVPEVRDVRGVRFYEASGDRNGLLVAVVDVPDKDRYRIEVEGAPLAGSIAVGEFPTAGRLGYAVFGGAGALSAGGALVGRDLQKRRRRLP